MEDRRFAADEAKFATQKVVTYTLLCVFTGVVATVLYQNDPSERSMILQTIINLTLLAVGYWLGASDSGKKQQESMSRIAEKAAPNGAKPAAPAATYVVSTIEEPKP